jgi:uncharacterized protein (TIGR02996 family)
VLELEQLDDRIGPVEQDLLDAIARGDDSSRAVYADWLEERGERSLPGYEFCPGCRARMPAGH